MKITVIGAKAERYKNIRDIFALFYGDCQLIFNQVKEDESYVSDFFISFEEKFQDDFAIIQLLFFKEYASESTHIESIRERVIDHNDIDNQLKRMARRIVYRALIDKFDKRPSPWGILTGIRPTKIVHRLLDKHWSGPMIIDYLINYYEVSQEKADLLLNVCQKQRPFLLSREKAIDIYSIYLGIPFCPSRCSYCSFPAYSLERQGQLLKPFLKALHKELSTIGQFLKDKGKAVQTIYLGGGTPTSLNEIQLKRLLMAIKERLVTENTIEFTVEAGRPDSITNEKLKIMQECGVSRISINPQTMNTETLVAIGRKHSPEDVIETFKSARELGFNNINMDIIIGLPGERAKDVSNTMKHLRGLNPENLTVHTLALKRASRLKQEGYDDTEDIRAQDIEEMLTVVMKEAKELQLYPYYLYRQKQMRGHLENIGYAKAGYECVYNIQMMEERQTIIGLGAGSGSKLVNCEDWTLESLYNPKDPLNYVERIEEIINKKLLKLEGLS